MIIVNFTMTFKYKTKFFIHPWKSGLNITIVNWDRTSSFVNNGVKFSLWWGLRAFWCQVCKLEKVTTSSTDVYSMILEIFHSEFVSIYIYIYIVSTIKKRHSWMFLLQQHNTTSYKTSSGFCLNFCAGEVHSNMGDVWEIWNREKV